VVEMYYRPYQEWTENELRNGIWHLNNSMSIVGGRSDKEELRQELRLRGLSDKGYHEE
jgi:hypothetical protein